MQNGKKVILYIDDEQDFRDAVRVILEANGYAMVEAPTAEAGLRVYKETHPDLVIVDLMMEEVDSGTSFVRDLQALGNTAPIYMLSSIGDRLYMNADYASLGLSGVFQKPIDPNTLLGVLRTRLN
ncbi:MAG: response regulator [Phycisphaerales bacterium]|nr:response regulator [Phycisphaerales bacterium]